MLCIGKTHFHHEGDYAFTRQEFAGYMHRPDIGCFFRDQKTGRVGAEKRFEKIGLQTRRKAMMTGYYAPASMRWLDEHSQEDDWNLYVGFFKSTFSLFYVKEENWNCIFQSFVALKYPDVLKPPFTYFLKRVAKLAAYLFLSVRTFQKKPY